MGASFTYLVPGRGLMGCVCATIVVDFDLEWSAVVLESIVVMSD